MPDGEVFTGPVEDSANGTILFSFPACYNGREVENVHLTFKDGKVVKATATKNEAFLNELLDMDRRRAFPGRILLRHQPRHPAIHQEHPVRRKDRRDSPLRGRFELRRIGRQEQIGPPLGHDLRPAPGRESLCGWQGVPQGRGDFVGGGRERLPMVLAPEL